jgi:hypothetical protein
VGEKLQKQDERHTGKRVVTLRLLPRITSLREHKDDAPLHWQIASTAYALLGVDLHSNLLVVT